MDHLKLKASIFLPKSDANMHALENSWSVEGGGGMNDCNKTAKGYDRQEINMLWEHKRGT